MPPRPFPYPLGIGTDITSISRVRDLLIGAEVKDRPAKLFRYMRQFLTYREQQDFWIRFHGTHYALGKGLEHTLRHLAGRWAAKEAVIKAVHWRLLSFKHIQILRRMSGSARGGAIYAVILDKPASSNGLAPGKEYTGPSSGLEQNLANPSINFGNHADHEKSDRDAPLEQPNETLTPAELQNDDLPGQVAQISISHDGDYATAVCLAAEEPRAGDAGGEAAAREP